MTEVAVGEIPIFPVFKGFRSSVVSEVEGAGDEGGNRFSSAFGKAVKGIGVGIAAAVGVAAAGIAAIGAGGLDRALNIQDAKQKLLSLGNSAESVDAIMQSALASVKGTAFGLGDAAGIAASAVAAGIAPGDELTRTLTATANAAAIAGVPLKEMGSIINKVATSGKLNTEVLQQFQDRGVPLLQSVAKQYGVTSEEAAKMVTEGKVNFADFQTALEASVGEGAVGAGKTARGAFQNIGAAFSRLGALFVQPAVDGAPTLFTTIAAAVDRATTAAGPLAAIFAGELGTAMTSVGGIIDGLNFDVLVSKILTVVQGIGGLYSLIVKGNFTGAFRQAFNVEEDSGVVTFILNARTAIGDLFAAVSTGDFSSLGESFSNISAVAQPLFPLFVELAKGIGSISGSIGEVFAAGIPLLVPILEGFAGALKFLGDNPAILAAAIIALAGAFAIQKSAATASMALVPLQIAADIARTAALVANTNATRANASATTANFLTRLPATASIVASVPALIASTAAMVAQKAAQVAGAVATGIATAAQWAFNAAMSANPIAIIIIAIAALVAGLIFFFTQTELGQEIWANFTRFLGEAWANIVAVATVVFTALGEFFANIWNFIVLVVTTYINLVLLVITTVINAIVTAWNATWDFVGQVISNVWSFIVSFVTAYINAVAAIITAVVDTISSVWNSTWSAIGSFFQTIWNAIVSFVSGVINGIASTISGFVSNIQNGVNNVIGFITGLPNTILGILGNLGNLLLGSGEALIQGFIDGITGMIGNVGDAVGGVMDFVAGFFPHSPAQRGPFSGSGWTQLKKSGGALSDQFISGFGPVEPVLSAGLDSLMNLNGTTVFSRTTGQDTASARGQAGSRELRPINVYEATNARQVALEIRQQEYAEVL